VTDTTTDMVAGQITPSPGTNRWWAWVVAVIGLVVLVAISIASLVPQAVVAEKENQRLMEVQEAPFSRVPASAESVNDRVVFGPLPDDVERFETDADFFFVTVSAPEQSLLSWFAGRGDPAIELLTTEDKFGFRTPQQRTEANLQSMRTAVQEAQFVALSAAGYEPEISLGEVIVDEMLCRTRAEDGSCTEFFPSDEAIDPLDKILFAEGVEMTSVEDLSAVLADKSPGDTAELIIDRPGVGELTVSVELSASPDDPTRTIVGFVPFDTRAITLPFEVSIDTGRIGGPSAGLAFTLALIDELTEGELTGGANIAVTGTINLDGSVGPIGGLTQKVNAVLQHDVEVFLVPASQFEFREPGEGEPDLRQQLDDAGHGDVEIIPVATLDDALDALVRLGGDPLVPVNS